MVFLINYYTEMSQYIFPGTKRIDFSLTWWKLSTKGGHLEFLGSNRTAWNPGRFGPGSFRRVRFVIGLLVDSHPRLMCLQSGS